MGLHNDLQDQENTIVTRSKKKCARTVSPHVASPLASRRLEVGVQGDGRASTPKKPVRDAARSNKSAAASTVRMSTLSDVRSEVDSALRKKLARNQEGPRVVPYRQQQMTELVGDSDHAEVHVHNRIMQEHRQILTLLESLHGEFLQVKSKLNQILDDGKLCCNTHATPQLPSCNVRQPSVSSPFSGQAAGHQADAVFMECRSPARNINIPLSSKPCNQQGDLLPAGIRTPSKRKRIMQLGLTEARQQRPFSFTRPISSLIGKRKKVAATQQEDSGMFTDPATRQDSAVKSDEQVHRSFAASPVLDQNNTYLSKAEANNLNSPSRGAAPAKILPSRTESGVPGARLVRSRQGSLVPEEAADDVPPALPPRHPSMPHGFSKEAQYDMAGEPPLADNQASEQTVSIESDYAVMTTSISSADACKKSTSDGNLYSGTDLDLDIRARSSSVGQHKKAPAAQVRQPLLYQTINSKSHRLQRSGIESEQSSQAVPLPVLVQSSRESPSSYDYQYARKPVLASDSESIASLTSAEKLSARRPSQQAPISTPGSVFYGSTSGHNTDEERQSFCSESDSHTYSLTADGQSHNSPTSLISSGLTSAEAQSQFCTALLRLCSKQLETDNRYSRDALEVMNMAAALGLLAKGHQEGLKRPSGSEIIYDDGLSDDGHDPASYPPPKR